MQDEKKRDRVGSLKSNSVFTKDVFHVTETNNWKAAEETLFHIFFLHRLICYGMSQRDHMERENVTKIA